MSANELILLGGCIMGILSSYYKIRAVQERKFENNEKEMKQYVNQEVSHLRELSFNEIKQLEKKIDSLRDDLRDNQKQLIELLTKKGK